MELKKGNMIKITLDDAQQDNCSDEVLWLDYKNITKVVEVGSNIYIDDGLISLQVKEIGEWRSGKHGYKLTHETSCDPLECLENTAMYRPNESPQHINIFLSLQVLISSRARSRTAAPWAARRE